MPELKFLDRYDGQSLDESIALEKTRRVDSLVLTIVGTSGVPIVESRRAARQGVSHMEC
jgi:hypothetical protein